MKPIDIIMIALVLVAFFFAARRAVRVFSGKKSCCSDGGSGAKKFATAHILDTDESHYPFTADITVKGMHCDNCVKNVTNALDSIDGTWATVDLESGKAHIRSKHEINPDAYRKLVVEAGYSAPVVG